VLTPLANLEPGQDYLEVTSEVALIPTPAEDWKPGEFREAARAQFGDWLYPSPRMAEKDGHPFDTRNAAALLSLEEGTPPIATERARLRARYAIAAWSVLKPPLLEEIMPDTGTWLPQPWINQAQAHKPLELGPARTPAQHDWLEYRSYRLPAEVEQIRLPFQALELVEQSRPAQALLTASWSLAQAGRASRLSLSDRLMKLYAAVAALCDPRRGRVRGAEILERWDRMSERVGTWTEIAGTRYSGLDQRLANVRLKTARDIATHGADAVLLDLGYPQGAKKLIDGRRTPEGSALALTALSTDLSALLHAARHATRSLWLEMGSCDWDEPTFEARFR
jgi:hypothetical protein